MPGSKRSSRCEALPPALDPYAVKIVVAGGFGVGKTTLVGSVSEIEPLTTEEVLTTASAGADSLDGVEAKTTTTVSMDFGRITLPGGDEPDMILMLFGTPGQPRFQFTWEDVTAGAVGAVVLADTRRLAGSFSSVAFFEDRDIPFVVAVNQFEGSYRYRPEEVRAALELEPSVPILLCDARDESSVATVLITLVAYAVTAAKSAQLSTSQGVLT
ncbi:GTP-binding protein [Streptomyces sp. AK02-01A]|uniref:GTP-binding protein n=1 Tax=Streptomyces sp. AK02-01A TaxID=3028648 RepID=UPI0039F70E07